MASLLMASHDAAASQKNFNSAFEVDTCKDNGVFLWRKERVELDGRRDYNGGDTAHVEHSRR